MTIDKKLEIKNHKIILTKKQQKQHNNQVKLINMNILQVKKHYLVIRIELQNKLSIFILLQEKLLKNIKTIENQGEKETKAFEELGKKLVKSKGKKIVLTFLKQNEIFDKLIDNITKSKQKKIIIMI